MSNIDVSTASSSTPRKSRLGEVVGGLVVIGIGLILLADNLDMDLSFFGWHNWWALFILIGAAAPASRAIDRYRETSSVDAQVVHSLISALAVVTVAVIFLLGASFGQWWPIFLVIGGLSMLVSGGKGRDCT